MSQMKNISSSEYSEFISILLKEDSFEDKTALFCKALQKLWNESVVLFFRKELNKTLDNTISKKYKNVFSSDNKLLFEKNILVNLNSECTFEKVPQEVSKYLSISEESLEKIQYWIGKQHSGFFVIQFKNLTEVCENTLSTFENLFQLYFSLCSNGEILNESIDRIEYQNPILTEIVEKTPNIVCYGTVDGKILYFNEIAALTFYSKSKKELLLEDIDCKMFKISYPEWVQELIETEAFPTMKEGGVWNGNSAIINYSGVEVPMLQTILGHYDKIGNLQYISTILKDITQSKIQEQILLSTVEEAQSANKSKSEFLANMSHEIRTPMNAILGFTEILRKEITDNRQKHFLDSIQLSGKTLLRLINDILDLSKIEAGKLEIQHEHTDLAVLANEIRLIFAEQMKSKNLEYSVDYLSQEQLYVFIDDVRLRQIFINLIGNAIKFTTKGYVKVFIRVAKNPELDSVASITIEVHDSGIGIPESKQKQIFEPFTQEDGQTTRKYGGTGLGLTITRKLVELMDGSVSLYSTPNHGSMFKIVFPSVKIGTNQQVVDQNLLNLYRTIQFNEPTVMIVDDMMSNREVIKEYLSDCNVSILECEDGTEALAYTLVEKPDLIFMVLRMAELDGYETTKVLKSHENTRPIPVVAITSALMDSDEKRFKELADGSLRKPVSRNDILSEMTKFLPYTNILDPAEQEVGQSEDDETTYENISEELLNQLVEYQSTSAELLEIISLDEIETFAQVLLSLGDMYDFKPLVHYANELAEAANTIDYSQLQKLLGKYSDFITNYSSK